MEGMRLFRRTRGLVINEKDALNVARQTVGVHSTYGDKDDANVDDVTANNKGKSIVIPDDIKGDYVKCLIILLYPMDASWLIIFLSCVPACLKIHTMATAYLKIMHACCN